MPVSPFSHISRAEAFRLISTRKQLATWFHVTDKKLCYLLYKKKVENCYREFTVRKRNGGKRVISAPSGFLKYLQRKIHEAVDDLFSPSNSAFGFVKGKSIVDHAKAHRNKKWVLCFDIKDFFPSINFGRVRGLFMAEPFSFGDEVATCLAQICCLNGALPQGAPSSPILSNIICLSLDRRMKELARKFKFTYSRYADDLCISSNMSLPPDGLCILVDGKWVMGDAVKKVFEDSGFTINHDKTKLRLKNQRQMVTGLVVNNKVGMPREWRRQLRVLLHMRRKYGVEDAMKIVKNWSIRSVRRNKAESIDSIITGKAGFAYHLEKPARPEFTLSLFRCYPGAREILPSPYQSFPMTVYTEGKTDGTHLMAAKSFFKDVRKFTKLNISLGEERVISGSSDLMAYMKHLVKFNPNKFTVGIFDCDEIDFMVRESLEPGKFRRLGGAIYIMCLGTPNHIAEGQRFCIEDLYRWEEASRFDKNERRLFKTAEFDEFGSDASGRFELVQEGAKDSIYVTSSVIRKGDGHSALLTKSSFAGYINRREYPFRNIEFYGFSRTFAVLNDIVRDYVGSP